MMREAQSTTGPSRLGRKHNRFRARSLEVAALGLASSAISESASATVIYTPSVSLSPDIVFSVDGSSEGRIRLRNQDAGGGEINLVLDAPGGMGMGMMPPSTVELAISPFGGDDFVSLLTVGNTIDDNLLFADEAFMKVGPTDNPFWAPGTTGYAGFVYLSGGTNMDLGPHKIEVEFSSPRRMNAKLIVRNCRDVFGSVSLLDYQGSVNVQGQQVNASAGAFVLGGCVPPIVAVFDVVIDRRSRWSTSRASRQEPPASDLPRR